MSREPKEATLHLNWQTLMNAKSTTSEYAFYKPTIKTTWISFVDSRLVYFVWTFEEKLLDCEHCDFTSGPMGHPDDCVCFGICHADPNTRCTDTFPFVCLWHGGTIHFRFSFSFGTSIAMALPWCGIHESRLMYHTVGRFKAQHSRACLVVWGVRYHMPLVGQTESGLRP